MGVEWSISGCYYLLTRLDACVGCGRREREREGGGNGMIGVGSHEEVLIFFFRI